MSLYEVSDVVVGESFLARDLWFPATLAIQTTGLLTLAPAGLSPAEHASLRWTHNRT